ncbi:MAG: MAPEG family protein [Abyssibacter sp.]|uniref:MAPEG family protein n=1 Tax=Abyssibacter sp. TaxID=2320200 RepID=UPI002EC1B440|nr:MAPEG family protein [Pseudomonadota bacterium]
MLYTATAVTAALNGLLILVLALRVSQLRIRYQVSLGDGGHVSLLRAIRAHANAAEHVPIFLVMLLLLEQLAPAAAVWSLGGLFVVARCLFSAALLQRSFSRPRQIGAGLTYLCELIVAVWLLLGGLARVLA